MGCEQDGRCGLPVVRGPAAAIAAATLAIVALTQPGIGHSLNMGTSASLAARDGHVADTTRFTRQGNRRLSVEPGRRGYARLGSIRLKGFRLTAGSSRPRAGDALSAAAAVLQEHQSWQRQALPNRSGQALHLIRAISSPSNRSRALGPDTTAGRLVATSLVAAENVSGCEKHRPAPRSRSRRAHLWLAA
jgi:hypothetical protein